MTEYLHHVPGRLRIRSKVFGCETDSRNKALRKLRAMAGVSSVRLNPKAASVTVYYDADSTDSTRIMQLLESCECMKTAHKGTSRKTKAARPPNGANWSLGKEVGKIAFNVIVSRSVTSLLRI